MKRVIAAILLLSAAATLSVVTGRIFRVELNTLLSSLDELVDATRTDSDGELTEKTQAVLLQWESSSGILHSLVMHEGMDDVEENITALPLLLEHSDRDEFRNKCIEAINQIKNLLDAEELRLENIL